MMQVNRKSVAENRVCAVRLSPVGRRDRDGSPQGRDSSREARCAAREPGPKGSPAKRKGLPRRKKRHCPAVIRQAGFVVCANRDSRCEA